MVNGLLRLIGLGVLVILAISVFFFVLHIAIRLAILGAIVVAILWIVRSFRGGGGQSQ